MKTKIASALVLAALALPGAAAAQDVPVARATLGKSQITLHKQAFLTPEELATLEIVLKNEQALSLFVPNNTGFAALAVSPEDGFIRGGQPVASAVALAELPDAVTAATEAIKACDQIKKGKAPCVLVLEVAPAS